ncbi:MAG TPA: hydantoinase B/oxoprolinase family protein, partial [Candidatus Obscuribacterales bacterium]
APRDSKAETAVARSVNTAQTVAERADPVLLELFNNQLMSCADEMGVVLQNTSHSVNIKERLDFSCAIFDRKGRLIANAPHIPVHLGSMSESVQSLMREVSDIEDGDVFLINNPYLGGTHLPDVTAISPVFIEGRLQPVFFVASRGHHADIGGITPGSMPPNSITIEEEGIIFSHFPLVKNNRFQEKELLHALSAGKFPARNPQQNVADLTAQIAANVCGKHALTKLVKRHGLTVVEKYMQFVRENASSAVRRAIDRLSDGSFKVWMDDGAVIAVDVKVNREERSATIDFTGTSSQRSNNMNAPLAITKAAVLYVFRTIVQDNIPLNDGCLEPIRYSVPEGSLLNPQYPAAVVAGNVETSQALVDALYGALGVLAASQGTMNNFTFGDSEYQYYETICGGAGAGPAFAGTDAVHTHMTNSRLTDPEILELRYPVFLRSFAIRRGSGGTGKFRGGDGVIREIEFRKPMTASILSQRRSVQPFGLAGGSPARTGRNYVRRKNGDIEELPATATVEVDAGDIFVIETPGGGGWGASTGS